MCSLSPCYFCHGSAVLRVPLAKLGTFASDRVDGKNSTDQQEKFVLFFNVNKRVPSTYLLDFDDTAVTTVIADNPENICICNDKNMYETFRPASARWNWNRCMVLER